MKAMRYLTKMGVLATAAVLLGGVSVQGADDDRKARKEAKKTKVCRRVKETGTHFSRKICKSQAEWDEIRRRDQEEMARSIPTEGGSVE